MTLNDRNLEFFNFCFGYITIYHPHSLNTLQQKIYYIYIFFHNITRAAQPSGYFSRLYNQIL